MATISGTATPSHTDVPHHAFSAVRGDDARDMVLPFTYSVTSTVTATASVAIFKLPPGAHRIKSASKPKLTLAGQGTCTVIIGLGAYTKPNGVVVAADTDAIVASTAVAPTHTATTALTPIPQLIESVGPVAVTALLTGNSPKLAVATTLEGFLVVRRENQS